MMHSRNLVALLAIAFGLAACGPKAQDTPASATQVEPTVMETGVWRGFPTDGSATFSGNTVTIPAGGGAMRIAANPDPRAGDTFLAHMRLTASSEVNVRIALVRHCNADRGEEGDSREITLSPTETDLTLRHSFSQPYDCVRVHIVSIGPSATVQVNELSLMKLPT